MNLVGVGCAYIRAIRGLIAGSRGHCPRDIPQAASKLESQLTRVLCLDQRVGMPALWRLILVLFFVFARTKLLTYFNSSIHKLFVEGNSNQTGNLATRKAVVTSMRL